MTAINQVTDFSRDGEVGILVEEHDLVGVRA